MDESFGSPQQPVNNSCNRQQNMYDSYDSLQNINITNKGRSGNVQNVSISEALGAFENLRISALTKAAALSPMVKEVTIGPKSPLVKKESYTEDISPSKENVNTENIEDSAKVSDELRHTLILKEYESEVNERSEELFRNLVERMIAKRTEAMTNYWKKHSEECERKALELRARKLQMLKEMQANDNLAVLEKAKQDQQQSQMISSQTIENMNRILEEQNIAAARLKQTAITNSHTRICVSYSEITKVIQTEPLGQTACDRHVPSINSVIQSINKIMDTCQTGSVTDNEVKHAELLASNIDSIKKKIFEDLNEIKLKEQQKKQEQEEFAKKQEAEKAQKIEAAKIIESEKKSPETNINQSRRTPLFFSQKNYNYFEELKNFLDRYESEYKELLENVNLKKFRFDCQKAVNTPVNALSAVSGSHIKDKFEKLAKLLTGERVQVLDTYVTASQHPQGLFYVTALLAKKIVRQGDLLVSSNPEAAFPLAAVAVALWAMFPDFGRLLEANFHRLCPYLVPMLLPQKEGQTDKEFYLSRGYTYNDEGTVEKQDKFLKRMSGIFRLQCAIWIAKTPRAVNAPNPHGLNHGWKWLASFINLKPEPDICATLLHEFFTICGSEFMKVYKKQFVKIIQLISKEYLAILQNIDEGGPKTRLEVFLQNVLKTGHIPPPTGLLPPNSW